jgi:hypothetical protein
MSPRQSGFAVILTIAVGIAASQRPSQAGETTSDVRDAANLALQATYVEGWHPGRVPSLDLYLLGIGDLRPGLLEELVGYLRHRLGIRIDTLSPLMFDRVTFDPLRRQIVADELISAVRRRYPTLARTFTFALRSPDHHSAVMSYARMDPVNLGMPQNEGTLRARLHKMVMKNS